MERAELYRQVFSSFKDLCGQGRQPSSFDAYCKKHGVQQCLMRQYLKDDFIPIRTLPGYIRCRTGHGGNRGQLYARIYEEFKQLCAEGRQPGTFKDYCLEYGVTRSQMHSYLNRNKLRVVGLVGYTEPVGGRRTKSEEIPFENVIFEEAGFLPADGDHVITVRVDGQVVVSFPADTDVAVIARFIRKMEKEAGHVGA